MMGLQATGPSEEPAEFEVGDYRFIVALNRIERGDASASLEPRAAAVLRQLLGRAPDVVTRAQLMDAVWPGVVVGDEALNNAINKLRKAFDDDRSDPVYIETLPKVGYRLIAPVRTSAGQKIAIAQRRARWTRIAAAASAASLVAIMVFQGGLDESITPALDNRDFVPSEVAAAPLPVLAVLPFENLNRDGVQDYFADGMTDDLINELAHLPGLAVISRSSSFAFRGHDIDIGAIANSLGARYIVEGSVRRAGDSLRINAQLVDTSSGRHLWAKRVDGAVSRVFALQDSITGDLVAALQQHLTIGPAAYATVARTRDLGAYDDYLRGSGLFQRFSRADTYLARAEFEKAVARDPAFPQAWAMLAWTHVFEYTNGWATNPDATLDTALALAERSIKIDDRAPVAHFVRGLVLREYLRFDAAAAEARRAIELQPSYANGYVLLATILYYDDRAAEGLALIDKAALLNPLHPSNYPFHRGQALFILERYREALGAFEKGLEQNPTSERLRVWLTASLVMLGRLEDARWESQEILRLDPDYRPGRAQGIFPFRKLEALARFNEALRQVGLPEVHSPRDPQSRR